MELKPNNHKKKKYHGPNTILIKLVNSGMAKVLIIKWSKNLIFVD